MKTLFTITLLGMLAFGQEKPRSFEAEIDAQTRLISRKIEYVAAQMDSRDKQLAEYRAMTDELVRLQDPQTARIIRPHLKRLLKILVDQGKIVDPDSPEEPAKTKGKQ